MIRVLYFLIVFTSCNFSQGENIEVIQAKRLIELQSEGVLVIDIRTKDEYDRGHISNVTHVNFYDDDFVSRIEELSNGNAIVIHCARGGRSGKAATKLLETGITKIYDYSGGFNDWKSKGLEIEY